MLTRAIQRGTVFTVLAILIFGLHGRAMAHANPVSSVPAAGATVAAPTEVVITFSELLDPAGSSIVVMDSAGATASEGTATVLANDNTTMRVVLRTGLAAGQYTVQWKSRSAADGDDAQGEFTFTVGATETVPATTSRLPDTSGGTGTQLVLIGLAAMLMAAGLGLRRAQQA